MPLVDIRAVVRNYGGLRPFRIRELQVETGEVVVIDGPDEQAAAVFTDLLTGTTLPDQGEILVAGRSTASLQGPEDWLAFLDRFGLVNARAVLLNQLTVAQNLAVARTLELDPMSADTRDAAVKMGIEVGLAAAELDLPLSTASQVTRLRVRLGRALAHDPSLLVIEHPTLGLERRDVPAAARLIRRIGDGRDLAVLVVSGDSEVVRRASTRALTWRPATGELVAAARWRRWLRP